MALFDGTANPRPSALVSDDDFDSTMPINSPYLLNKPPPEFPGLTCADVWTKLIFLPSMVMSRAVAETMPSVTVPDNVPKGFPIATAFSPVVNLLESPITAAVKLPMMHLYQ